MGCCDRQPVNAPWSPWQGFRRTKCLGGLSASASEYKIGDKDEKEEKKIKRKKRKKKENKR